MKKNIYFIGIILFCFSIHAQSQKELYNQGIKYYEAKDYANFLKSFRKIDSLRPSHPTYTYNLACAYALTNDLPNSINTLRKVILMNNKTPFEDEPDLIALKDLAEYKGLLELKSDLNKTISNSKKRVSLSEKTLHPEGLCYLKKSKTWLATSIRNRKIISFDSNTGQCIDWLKTDDMYSVFFMKPDNKEEFLWVSTAAMPEMLGYSNELDGKAEILKVDIKTKKIVGRFAIDGNHVFGDLTVSKNGTVYVSDSGKAVIYKIEKEVVSEYINLENEAYNLQGITFNDVENTLFIADYFKGLLVIPMDKPQNRKWLKFPINASFKGIDGLVFYNNSLIAIHNGVKPIRIMHYFLNSNYEISHYKILDNNRIEFDEPAQAIIIKNKLYYFANCPWNAYDKNRNLEDTKFESPMLFELKLNQ